jgi:hypothetical protein
MVSLSPQPNGRQPPLLSRRRYKASKLPYKRLVGAFWRAHDPTRTASDGQFGVPGPSIIWAGGPAEAEAATKSKLLLERCVRSLPERFVAPFALARAQRCSHCWCKACHLARLRTRQLSRHNSERDPTLPDSGLPRMLWRSHFSLPHPFLVSAALDSSGRGESRRAACCGRSRPRCGAWTGGVGLMRPTSSKVGTWLTRPTIKSSGRRLAATCGSMTRARQPPCPSASKPVLRRGSEQLLLYSSNSSS